MSEYPNAPCVAVGAVVIRDGKVLLIRRGKAPGAGLWAIPGGRVDLGEPLETAVEREILEETGLTIRVRRPVLTFDVIRRDDSGRVRFHYVIVDFEAQYVAGDLRPGDDALDARWVAPEEMAGLEVNPKTLQLLMEQFGWPLNHR